jgi:hypothetical protein
MKFKSKILGFEEVSIGLRHMADKVADASRKQMHRTADKIVKEAQLNAPVDLHNLEQSIHKDISYGERGRLKITVVAGGVVNGVNVDQYAALIHENYESMQPGAGTIAKRAANPGRYIGEKFLERAADDQRGKLEKAVIGIVSLFANAELGVKSKRNK